MKVFFFFFRDTDRTKLILLVPRLSIVFVLGGYLLFLLAYSSNYITEHMYSMCICAIRQLAIVQGTFFVNLAHDIMQRLN
jgi:hypothetical protein